MRESFKIGPENKELLKFPNVLERIFDADMTLEDILQDPKKINSLNFNDNNEKINEFIYLLD